MTIARHYVMHAADGKDAVLEAALGSLAAVVRAIAGCEGVELLRDLSNERRFIFIEKWESIEAHKAGGKQIPKEEFGPMMAALDGPPDGAYFGYLRTI